MANVINTRIQLKYDSLADWQTINPTLLEGEIACVSIGEVTTDNQGNRVIPPVMMKVGPGAFNSLGWTAAKAADVYAWAKKETPDWTDFPALPITVEDNGTGKFITGITYNNNKIVITRADAVNSIAAADNSLAFDKSTGDVKANVKISANANNILEVKDNGLYVPAPAEVVLPGTDNKDNAATVPTGDTVNVVSNGTISMVDGKYTLTEDYVTVATKQYVDNVDTGVMSVEGKQAIKTTGDDKVTVELAIDSAKGNVELTQSDAGLKANVDLSAYRLIADDENTEYHIEYDSTAREIKLVAGANAEKMSIDATEFIKDGMIKTVNLVTADDTGKSGQFLEIVWNTPELDDEDTVTYVDLTTLIKLYTIEGTNTATINTTASTNGNKHTVSAAVIEGSLTNAHIAANAAIAKTKLAKEVQDTLGLVDTAIQSVSGDGFVIQAEDMGGTNVTISLITDNDMGNVQFTHGMSGLYANVDLSDYQEKATAKIKQTPVNDPTASGATLEFIDSITQNANGEITATKKGLDLTLGVVERGLSEIADLAAGMTIALNEENGFGQFGQAYLENTNEISWAPGTTTEPGTIQANINDYSLSASKLKANADYPGEDKEVWIFNCGSASINI